MTANQSHPSGMNGVGEHMHGDSESRMTDKDLVDLRAVTQLADRLAATIDDGLPTASAGLYRLLARLLEPHVLLSSLHELADAALDGNRHAQQQFEACLQDVVARLPEVRRAGSELISRPDSTACSGSSVEDMGSPAVSTLRFHALSELLIAAARSCACETEIDMQKGVHLVIGLVAQTAPLERLRLAHEQGGDAKLIRELQWMASMQALGEFAPPLRTMSGSLPGLPGLPGVPGLPGKVPGGLGGNRSGGPVGPNPPEGPGGVDTWLQQLFGKKKPFHWDPEIWDHKPIWGRGGWGSQRDLRCAIALGKLAAARLAKPPQPIRAVWSDNIDSIEAPNPCGGQMLRIHGHGFGSPKPSNAGLMLSRDGKCTPTPFVPGIWQDDMVEIALPADVTSGPIGFVDLDFAAAYDAWADGVNNALLTLKFNGCGAIGKGLLVDHFSECPPATAVNALQAGAAYIHAFTVNTEPALAVVEPGDTLAFAWDVVNATGIRLERTSAQGPLFGGQPVANGLSEVGSLVTTAAHPGPETWTYRLTAFGRCANAVTELTVIATKLPGLSVQSIEITQGLQTIPASVRMVAGKPTVVRVTVRHGLNGWGADSVPNTTGRIRVVNGGAASAWFDAANGSAPMAPTPGASITVPSNPQRQNTNDTLNFLVPGALCTGNPTFRVEVRVSGFDARPNYAGITEVIGKSSASVIFEGRRMLELRWVQLNWSGTVTPLPQCDPAIRAALPMLPAPGANIAAAPAGIVTPTGGNMMQDALDQLDDLHNCSTWEALTEWLGSDCPDEDDTKWVGVTFAATGGIGQQPGNCCIVGASFVSTVAHELSHNFNQAHLTSVCAGGGAPANAENASGFPNGGQILDTPFDMTTNQALKSGTGLWDVMTYCNKVDRWPTAERWRRLWDEIG